jgi:hypothetical protein
MKQTSSDRQSSVESATTDLNPHLQEALGCLDIKLEDELTRFRQQQDRESVQVIEETWLQDSTFRDSDSSIMSAEIVAPRANNITLEAGDYEVLPPSEGFAVLEARSAAHHPQRMRSSAANYAPAVGQTENVTLPPEELDLNFSQGGAIAPFHNEYLASSHELLRQIQAEEPTSPTAEPVATPPKRKFFTPLRVSSIAALCVITGGAVYTYLNPSVLNTLTGAKVATVTTTTTASNLGQSIQSPNLAANEFTDISLSNLNTISVNTAPTTSNVTQAATTTTSNTTAANPVAIPYTPVNPQTIVPPKIVQPKVADSLVKSLLPGNFQQLAREYQKIRTSQPGVKKPQP